MTASDPSPPKTPRPGRGLRVALALSLGVNLLVLGLVGGAVLNHLRGDDHPPVRDLGFGPFTEALSPADRSALLRSYAAQSDGLREERRQMRAQMAAILDALRAEPFDAEALKTAMTAQVDRLADRLHVGQRLLTERLLAMSPDERHAFADRLEAAAARGPRPPGDRDRDRNRPPPPGN